MAAPALRSLIRSTARVLAVLAMLAGLAAAGFTVWLRNAGSPWLERIVRERIGTAVEKASVAGYHFTLDSLRADARSGDIRMTGVELSFDAGLADSLRKGVYHYLFAAKAARIELHGLSLWKLLVQGEFHVHALVLDGPGLSYYVNGKHADLADPFKRMGGTGSGGVAVVMADTLAIRGANATVHDPSEHLPMLSVSGLDLKGIGVRITRGAVRSGVRLAVADANIRLDSISAQLPDGGRLHIGAIRLARKQRVGMLSAITLTPPPADTTDLRRLRKGVVTASVDSIEVTGLDLDRAITNEALHLQCMSVHGMHIAADLDMALPFDTTVIRQLPPAALASMPFSIRIDTLQLADGEVTYRERNATTRRWGVVPFTALQARFLQIDNDPEEATGGAAFTGEFSGMLFHAGRFTGTYRADADEPGRFSIGVSLTDMPLTALNMASRPLLRMELEAGRLRNMTLRMEGDERRAKGTLALDYSGLLLRVEPGTPQEVRHSLFGGMLSIVQAEAYGGGLNSFNTHNINVERDPRRSIFNYVWRFTREGLMRNIRPEMRERLRTVLRSDADKRREQRAARKGRKAGAAR